MIKQMRISTFAIFFISILSGVLSAGAAPQDKGTNEDLLAAITNGDTQTVSKLLSKLPSGVADVNARDEDGLTALMYAGADCVELLLAKSADPNARSNGDVTALMLAVGDARKVRLLLAKGAEVNAKSKQGHTALSLAAGRASGGEGSAEVVKALLDHGAELPATNLLGAAARSGDIRVMKLLLEKGADPNDRNNIGGAR